MPNMRELYTSVVNELEKVDFDAIWKGFTPCDFALYDNKTVYLKDGEIPWDERFMGNTAINIDGVSLAIWTVENPDSEDIEILAMCIVHEMFHAFQTQQGESRHVNEFAMFTYPHDLDNYQLKMAENHYLAKALEENCMINFQQFAVMRQARKRIIGDAIIQEFNAETFEGMAEYAGVMALKQISQEKFVEDAQYQIKNIRNPDNLFNMRRMSYFTGCLLCMTLKQFGIDFHHNLSETRPLFDLIQWEQNSIETSLHKFQQDLQSRFDNFRKSHNTKTGCNAQITGFDPMNMKRLDDEFLCDNFVVLEGEFIKGPVLLIMEKDSLQQVKAYITK